MIQTEYLREIVRLQNAMLLVLGYAAVSGILHSIPTRTRRINYRLSVSQTRKKRISPLLLKLLEAGVGADAMAERRQLLLGAGLRITVPSL